MKATVTIVKITPDLAEKMLSTQVKEQRPLRDTHVQTLTRDMKDGNFRLSADALVIIKGALANGQHRLWAVVESNTPQQFLLMETDDDELYKVLDCGIRRTVSDAANITNGCGVASIARLVLGYKSCGITQHSYTKRPTRIEMIEYIQANNSALQDAFSFVQKVAKKGQNLAPPSSPATLIIIASHWHGAKPKEFLEAVYLGGNPEGITHDLRERFIKLRMATGRYSSAQYYLALLIKSFNAYVSGSKLGVIKMLENESYPQIIKPKP